ncbi:hypothetical protein OROHE_010107 [Orobanche hederae]
MDSGKEKLVQQLEALLGQLSLMDPGKQEVVAAPPWKQQIEKLDLNSIEGLLRALVISTNHGRDPVPSDIVAMFLAADDRGVS